MADRTVRQRYFTYALTVPANTPLATPLTFDLPVFETVWESVDVLIPAGHAGLTGIAFDYANARIVPWGDASSFVQGNDQTVTLAVGLQVSDAVEALTYNDGTYDHTFYVRMLLRYVEDVRSAASAPLALVV